MAKHHAAQPVHGSAKAPVAVRTQALARDLMACAVVGTTAMILYMMKGHIKDNSQRDFVLSLEHRHQLTLVVLEALMLLAINK
jgi:hypothetical protein